MFVALLPLFFAANIGVNESNWKYGPEVIFDAKIDSMTPPFGKLGKAITLNATMKLNCRPTNEMILTCNYTTNSIVLTVLKTLGKAYAIEHSKDFRDIRNDEDFFELDFDFKNSDPISFSNRTAISKVRIAKALVDQLKVGMNFMAKPIATERFDIMENSIAGNCPTTYVVTSQKIDKDDVRENKKSLQKVVIGPAVRKLREGKTDIQIIRNISKCRNVPGDILDRKVLRSLATSKSHVTITTNNFTSYTDYEVFFQEVGSSLLPGQPTPIGTEKITISLDKIIPANGPLPEIIYTKGYKQSPVFCSASFMHLIQQHQYDIWLSMAEGIPL